ncbi:response regulator transcription factor [Seohaeicola saemankumensis]|uniref:helix-turn-helix transcriptional regulator n=1 Tax=Seohaeicola TaxID=481178 RepID=UPI0035D04484
MQVDQEKKIIEIVGKQILITGLLKDYLEMHTCHDVRLANEELDVLKDDLVRRAPDLVIFDAGLINRGTREWFDCEAKKYQNSLRILMGQSGLSSFIVELFSVGVSGYVPYDTPRNSLVAIIELVLAGEKFFPQNSVEKKSYTGATDNFIFDGMTKHEITTLKYLAEGLSNKEIAKRIGKSEVSVKLYTTSIFQKIGAKNRTHAVVLAFRNGIGVAEQ